MKRCDRNRPNKWSIFVVVLAGALIAPYAHDVGDGFLRNFQDAYIIMFIDGAAFFSGCY